MSVNFSTITPMSQSTISRTPAFTTAAAAQQPAASNPILNHPRYQEPKKSHWFRNTLIAAAVLVAGATALRGKVGMFKDFDKAATIAKDAKLMDKAAYYGKKAVAEVGDFVIKYANMGIEYVKNLFKKPDVTA